MIDGMEIVWAVPEDDGPGDPGDGEEVTRRSATADPRLAHLEMEQRDRYGGI